MPYVSEKEWQEILVQIRDNPKGWRSTWKAYPPHVSVKDDTHPRPWETYNCTTCVNGGPEESTDPTRFRRYCSELNVVSKGYRWQDISHRCGLFDNKFKRPRKGYWPGIE
jgi:hypothetical protein